MQAADRDALVAQGGDKSGHGPKAVLSKGWGEPPASLPSVVVEVLSTSTECWDRGGKFGQYRRVASLQESQ